MERRLRRRLAGTCLAAALAAGLVVPPAGARNPRADEVAGGARSSQPPEQLADVAAGEPGRLIVKRAAGARGLDRALTVAGGRSAAALGRRLHVVEVAPGTEKAAAARLAAQPEVEYVEPDYFRSAASHVAGEVEPWGVRRVGAPAVWSGQTGKGVRIAVIDSGVERMHPELSGRVASGYDVYGGNGKDNCGHGTAVAGVAAAGHGDGGLVGVAPQAEIVPVKVLRYSPYWDVCGSGDTELIKAITWVAHPSPDAKPRADVINLSLSGPQRSQALEDAVRYAARKGVLIVAASGNDGSITVNYPAAYPDVLSVGGVRRDGTGLRWWRYGSYGAVDVAAPAKSIPVIQAASADVAVGRPCTVAGQRHVCADGTSFAAPHVAGVAALLYEQHRTALDGLSGLARVRRLRQWVAGTAADVEGTPIAADLKTGHGVPDAAAATRASTDRSRVLVTWQTPGRVIAPSSRMPNAPRSLPVRAVATDGEGRPLAGRVVSFTPSGGGSLTYTRQATSTGGVARTKLRSNADGRLARVTATLDTGQRRSLFAYVLDRDDNVPGAKARRSPFRDSLDAADDFDDVWRFRLRAGETIHARVGGLGPREDVAVYLHRGSTRDVNDPEHAPLREDSASFEDDWLRLKRTVRSDGVRYLHADGYGTYRLKWWIASPGKVTGARVAPQRITPDGDGVRDRTTVTWRVRQRGRVRILVRNSAGRTVAASGLGVMSKGLKAARWNGRNDSGRKVRPGSYRVVVRWRNHTGRIATTSARVHVDR